MPAVPKDESSGFRSNNNVKLPKDSTFFSWNQCTLLEPQDPEVRGNINKVYTFLRKSGTSLSLAFKSMLNPPCKNIIYPKIKTTEFLKKHHPLPAFECF